MKIKNDFVTNSSSSSFIVVFDKKITQFEDVQHLIPGPETKAQQVLKDAKSQKPIKLDKTKSRIADIIATELTHGFSDDLVGLEYGEYRKTFCKREGISSRELYGNRSWQQIFYKEYKNMTMKACLKKANEFIEEHEGKYMYIFEYGDEDGHFMSEMEHGGTFRRVAHIKISKH